jgi:hypothetical protein
MRTTQHEFFKGHPHAAIADVNTATNAGCALKNASITSDAPSDPYVSNAMTICENCACVNVACIELAMQVHVATLSPCATQAAMRRSDISSACANEPKVEAHKLANPTMKNLILLTF